MKKTFLILASAFLLASCGVDSEEFKNKVKAGNIEFVKTNIDALSKDEKTITLIESLDGAISSGHWELASYLVEQGALGTTHSLALAIKSQQETLALQMIAQDDELGIESNTADNIYDGGTPLQYALAFKQNNVALQLIKNGAMPSNIGSRFHPPLWIAAETNSLDLVKAILAKNNNAVNISNVDGETPIYPAIRNNNTEIVSLLVENGAEIKDAKIIALASNANEAIKALIIPTEVTE